MTENRKIRVVLFSPALGAVSGVSTHVKMLLSSTLSRDFELLHFQVGSEGRNEGIPGKLWRVLSSPLLLAVFLLRHRADIVHLNTALDRKAFWRDLVYLSIARALGCKVVSQFHGGALPQDFLPHNRLLTTFLRRTLLASHAVSVLSTQELKAHQDFSPKSKVHLIPNAIEGAGLINVPRVANRDGPLRLVYVGRLVATKGLFDIVEALKLVRTKGVPFLMRIAGDGPDAIQLREAVLKARLENEVTFVGPMFGDAKHRLWLDSDVFVFPTYFEGLPYALLEAMAAGCVTVTCAVAAIPDVIQDGVHGLFVPPRTPPAIADALIRLDADRDFVARAAQAGRERIKANYTSARLTEDFRRLYNEL